MKRGLWWAGAATVAMRILDVGGSLLVLQFLTRAEVGLAALAWSVAVLLESFNGLGVSYVVVRQRNLSHADLSGIFWFSTLLGAAVVAIMAAVGPFVAVFYADWRLYPMMLVAATKLVFVGAALVPLQLLTRDLRFREVGTVQTLATLGEALTKVILVLAGFGAWGLVFANLARGVFLCAALWWFSPFRPALRAADAAVRQAIRFGLRVSASNVAYQLYRNMDNLLIGRILGTSVLGIYQIAFQLGMTPLEIVVQLVNRVQFPIYAALREKPAELARAFSRSPRTLLLILGPVTVFLCFASRDLLSLIGGGKWLPAVPLIQVLVWASLLRGVSQLFSQVYVATGQTRYAFIDTSLTGCTLVAGFVLALLLAPAGQGALWVALVWLVSYPVPLAANYVMIRRSIPFTLGDFLGNLARPVLGIAVLALIVGLASGLAPALGSPWASLLLVAGLTLGVHVLYLHRVLHLRLSDILPRKSAAG